MYTEIKLKEKRGKGKYTYEISLYYNGVVSQYKVCTVTVDGNSKDVGKEVCGEIRLLLNGNLSVTEYDIDASANVQLAFEEKTRR